MESYIQKNYELEQELVELKEKQVLVQKRIKRAKMELLKYVHNEFCEITNDKSDCVSKKFICDMMRLDYKNQKHLKPIITHFKRWGIEYKASKMISGVSGAFLGIKLLESS